MEVEDYMKKNKCNEIHIKSDKKSKCTFIFAMNSEYADKGNGGTRMMNYGSLKEGIEDATKLIDVMTKKCIIIGKKYNGGYSGGKGVIVGNPKTQKTPDMLRRYGEFVQSFNGRFQTGTDMNINLKDINYMAEKSEFIDGLESGLGDTAIPTAYGILVSMKVMCKNRFGSNSLKGKKIAIQGVGSVGENLIKYLIKEEADIIASDVDTKKLEMIGKKYKIKIVKPSEIYAVSCDIFSPNACGGILTSKNINQLKCEMIIGAANNPLSNGLETVKLINNKKIIYVPDYIVNIGGVFLSMCEVQKKSFNYVIKKLKEIIEIRLQQILKECKRNESLFESSERLIERERNLK
jgi:leucine dehydrogenase|tara:strand:- start:49 stop:1095 length:1047 start_codon:yes stop_codon:yes gene_type:complete